MTTFNFNEEIGELPYVAAVVGASTYLIMERSGLDSTQLFERLWNTLTASEQVECERHMTKIHDEYRKYSFNSSRTLND